MENNNETFTDIIKTQISMLERDITVKQQELVDTLRQIDALKGQLNPYISGLEEV